MTALTRIIRIALLAALFAAFQSPANAQEAAKPTARPQQTAEQAAAAEGNQIKLPEVTSAAGVPLVVDGEEILRVRVRLGPYGPERRVESIKNRLKNLEEQKGFTANSIVTREASYGTDIISGDTTLMAVTDADARTAGNLGHKALAEQYVQRLRNAVSKDVENHTLPKFLMRVGLAFGTTIALIIVWSLIGKSFEYLMAKIESWRGVRIRSLKLQRAVLLSSDTFTDMLLGLCSVVRLVVVLVVLATYATIVLGYFPETRELSQGLIVSILQPIKTVILPAVLGYLPNIAFIAVIIVASHYVLAFTRFIFNEVGRGTIGYPGFDPEWAEPTYKIARFLLIAFALVLIFPYLPGSGSPAFQQISLFLGILVSLGSSSAVSHIIAGVFLTYTGAFKIGDRVKISDTTGDVVEKTLLATRIKTTKHEYVTIPNAMVLGAHMINYSRSAQDEGLILHTTVTIGYDVPWKTVHELLIAAALDSEHIRAEPKPFVLQTSLDDNYVSYEINCYTKAPHMMASLYSALHQNIQNKFNEAGVEIMSPHYTTLRDGNKIALPDEYLGSKYEAPSFSVTVKK